MHSKKTIYALSSGMGKAAIAIYRISGPSALESIIKFTKLSHIEPKFMYRGFLKHPVTGELIDDAMFVFFKAPNSFTGEDLVEIYTHGSIAVHKILTISLSEMEDLRYAEAGEFARRALLNGKTDLTKIEGLMDLINAETSMQHKQAINQMQGYLFELCSRWRRELISAMSLVEAYIDFPDEDIPEEVICDTLMLINNIKNSLENFLQDDRKGERLRSGITMAIFGKVNAGKSSLMNYLTKRDVSIVSNTEGTTRDIVESHLDIGGYPIILIDTAGIRDTDNPVEQEGIKRAIKALDTSDIKIIIRSIEDEVLDYKDYFDRENLIFVANKIDLLADESGEHKDSNFHDMPEIKISVKSEIGLESLINEIIKIASKIAGSNDKCVITQERHRICIKEALNALNRVDLTGDLVLAAEDLRLSARSLLFMIGKIDAENILDNIFSSFCIGK
ncbi:MAG: tRNA uridine-5-carboxymethylaminomethyl(34) synthesis GTPase MnmE [Rickettsiaceae bacterium]|nr:tRNA uridine-5-carboxymethylaminomethyl(34) synthesis GTPase MnmE [Rickettsiaceae bacterium]